MIKLSEAFLQSQILYKSDALGIESDGIEAREQVVFPFVQTRVVQVAIEASIGQAFVVVTPAYSLVLEKIDYCGDITVDENEAVTVQSEGVAACRSDVILEQRRVYQQKFLEFVGDGPLL